MKIIAIGDIHGKVSWHDIVNQNPDADKIIFIGDYFDNYNETTARSQIDNFNNIVEFKKLNPDRVILLTGNHCYHYFRSCSEQYAGYQKFNALDIQEALHKALDNDLMQMCYIQDNILFSHAGVTKTWCKNNKIDLNNLQDSINDLFKYKPNSFRFTRGRNNDNYGDDVTQSPIWVRPQSLYVDRIDGYLQVVGHTQKNSIDISNHIIFIDTLGSSKEYLQIENGNFLAVKIF